MEESSDTENRVCPISELPPQVLVFDILQKNRTKDVIRFCALSMDWKHLWKSVPILDLAYADFPDYNSFVTFVDVRLGLNRDNLEKFKLKSSSELRYEMNWDEPDADTVNRWISIVLHRNVKQLHIQEREYHDYSEKVLIPQSLYTCQSLQSLKLCGVIMETPKNVSLPALKHLKLESVEFSDDFALELLVSSCPILESLTLKRGFAVDLRVFSVRSRSLLRFTLIGQAREVLIDAPRLDCLKLYKVDVIRLHNTHSILKLQTDSTFNVNRANDLDGATVYIITDFLLGISRVKEMEIASSTLEVIGVYSRCNALPLFHQMCFLHVHFWNNKWKTLPFFLEQCPNLKSVSLSLGFPKTAGEEEQVNVLYAPRRLLTSLEYVRIVKIVEEETGLELASYFLEHSSILKEFTIRFNDFRPFIRRKLLVFRNALVRAKFPLTDFIIVFGILVT